MGWEMCIRDSTRLQGYLLGGGMGESFPLVGALLLTAVTRWVVGPRWEKHRAWTSPLLAGGMVFLAGVVPLLYGSHP